MELHGFRLVGGIADTTVLAPRGLQTLKMRNRRQEATGNARRARTLEKERTEVKGPIVLLGCVSWELAGDAEGCAS